MTLLQLNLNFYSLYSQNVVLNVDSPIFLCCYQILHHCVCIGVRRCIYAVAKETAIIYSVMVTFSNKLLYIYRKTVVFVVERFIPFLENPLQLPSYPDGEAWGYAESRTLAIQQMHLWAQYIRMV